MKRSGSIMSCVHKEAGELGRLKPGCFRSDMGIWLGDRRRFELSHRRKEIERELRHIQRAKRLLREQSGLSPPTSPSPGSSRPESAPGGAHSSGLVARTARSGTARSGTARSDGALPSARSARLPVLSSRVSARTQVQGGSGTARGGGGSPARGAKRTHSLFDSCPFAPPVELLLQHGIDRRGEASMQIGLQATSSPQIDRVMLPQGGLNHAGKRLSFTALDPFKTTESEHFVRARPSDASWVLQKEFMGGSGIFAKYMQNCIEKNVDTFAPNKKEKN